jgi:hypothetical protein
MYGRDDLRVYAFLQSSLAGDERTDTGQRSVLKTRPLILHVVNPFARSAEAVEPGLDEYIADADALARFR